MTGMIIVAIADGDDQRARIALARARRRMETLEARYLLGRGVNVRRLQAARCAYYHATRVAEIASSRFAVLHWRAAYTATKVKAELLGRELMFRKWRRGQ